MTAVALAIVGLVGPTGATAAQSAPGGTFASSFEATDPPALVTEPYAPPVGISGPTEPRNSAMSHVIHATAGTENTAAGEGVANILDGNSRTKWLSNSVAPWWAIYEADEPVLIREYTLTSANDSVERDPAAWTIAGSEDGTSWTTLDSRTGQSFGARYEVRQFSITQPQVDDAVTYRPYKFFRFTVTARGGGGSGSQMMQLGDWTLYAGTEVPPPPTPPTVAVGSGPGTGFDIRANVGFDGVRSLSFGGTLTAAAAKASAVIYSDLNVAIGTESELSYAIFPTLDGPSYTYLSTYVAVDLEVTDADGANPTLMSLTPGIVDQYGFPASALGQGTSKILVCNFWNSMKVDLSALAGKKVTKVLFTYETDRGEAGTAVSAWVDSIKIADAVRIDPSSLTNYVDVRRGTWGGMSESRGINIPATTVPNGFNYLMPMTGSNDAGREQYYYMSHNTATNLTPLRGLIISHQPSPHIQDRLTMAFMPSLSQSGTPNAALTNRQLTFKHSDETAQPEIYRVVTQEGLTAEMTPTDHGGVMRFTFPETNTAGSLIADRQGWDATYSWAEDGTLTGYTDGGYGNNTGRSRMFIYGSLDCTPTATGTGTSRAQSRWARCDLGASKQMQFRFATSYLSQAQAQHNFAAEVPWTSSFDLIQAATRATWNQRLSVIDLSGSSTNDTAKRTVYSDLYRLNTYPSSHFENTAAPGDTPVYKFASPVNPTSGAASATETNAEIRSGRMYTNNGFWDTYRSAWPAYAMFYPDSSDGIIDGIVEQYRSGGWISRWTAPGYVDAMTGTSSDASFAEAYVAGALPTDIALDAYDAAVKNATVLPTSPYTGMPAANVGRKGWSTAPYQGYTDTSLNEAVSWGMEGDINDAAIAKMAAKLATDPATPDSRRDEIATMADYLARRAQNYSNYFDPSIGFFQGVTRAGDFQRPASGYDPTSWNYGFTESNAWTFAFHAPFDVAGMAALYGSQQALVNKVQALIDTPDRQNASSKEQHEARDTRLGQLGISNQTSYHIPYIPAAAGKPALTQRIMRDAVGRLESGGDIGQGYLGDEDNGAMASWYLYAALGFYPLNLASGEYTIGSPAYDKMTVRFEGGGSLTINAPGNSQSTWYVAGVTLDGVALTEPTLKQADILDGGHHVLDFTMSPTPTTWGETELTPVDPIPPRDATKAGYGTVSVSDGTASAALNDDNSATTATFAAEAADVRWTSDVGPVAVARYTLTNGPSGPDPQAWTLSGSDDGTTWTVLDTRQGETFRWDTQLRPFAVANPALYSHYKVAITETSDGGPATVAEVELLVEPAQDSSDTLTIATSSERTATVGAAHAIVLGRVLGGTGDPGTIEASVDFGDGTTGSATAIRSPLGGVTLSTSHVYATPGVYSIALTVTDSTETATGTVDVYARPLTGIGEAFDNSCLTEVGVPVPCDDANSGLGIARLAAAGYVQGQTMALGTTGLTFTPRVTQPGDTDNLMTPGVTFPVDLGAGATRISVVGFSTNAPDEGLTG
ncbi:MAG: GH92 family glycosyl hydrolase, partial [Bifidobacteriaceae bacterium]|nr:GH92 family glycosyl hydrolase [Bifidobacteriaceae bacterium]